jgi:hypothetical protein
VPRGALGDADSGTHVHAVTCGRERVCGEVAWAGGQWAVRPSRARWRPSRDGDRAGSHGHSVLPIDRAGRPGSQERTGYSTL